MMMLIETLLETEAVVVPLEQVNQVTLELLHLANEIVPNCAFGHFHTLAPVRNHPIKNGGRHFYAGKWERNQEMAHNQHVSHFLER
jgi:hypothetical protein